MLGYRPARSSKYNFFSSSVSGKYIFCRFSPSLQPHSSSLYLSRPTCHRGLVVGHRGRGLIPHDRPPWQRLRGGTSATKRRPSSRHNAAPTRMLRCRRRVAPPCWSVEQATGDTPTVDRHGPLPGRRWSGPGSTKSVSLGLAPCHEIRAQRHQLRYSGRARLGPQNNLPG